MLYCVVHIGHFKSSFNLTSAFVKFQYSASVGFKMLVFFLSILPTNIDSVLENKVEK